MLWGDFNARVTFQVLLLGGDLLPSPALIIQGFSLGIKLKGASGAGRDPLSSREDCSGSLQLPGNGHRHGLFKDP